MTKLTGYVLIAKVAEPPGVAPNLQRTESTACQG